jgi:putative transposase
MGSQKITKSDMKLLNELWSEQTAKKGVVLTKYDLAPGAKFGGRSTRKHPHHQSGLTFRVKVSIIQVLWIGDDFDMRKSHYTEEQIASALRQAELGTKVVEVCRKMGISEQTFY